MFMLGGIIMNMTLSPDVNLVVVDLTRIIYSSKVQCILA
jgi:hypothetical protein